MGLLSGLLALAMGASVAPLAPGDHTRQIVVGDRTRSYLLHIPTGRDAGTPLPVVLALHPFATNGPAMARMTGLSRKADREGFVVLYPNGTGRGTMLRWNVGEGTGERADDVKFLGKLLDEVALVVSIDPKRVYATGYSNGGMMCYRLAVDLPGRIAAIATVAGTMTDAGRPAERPVPVMLFHGTDDKIVPYDGGSDVASQRVFRFHSVGETVGAWTEADGCPRTPASIQVSQDAAGLTVKRLGYGPGKSGSEVVVYTIQGGGHTWPGQPPVSKFLGKSTLDLNANDLIWEFFKSHPLP